MARGTSIRTKLIAASTLLMVGVVGLLGVMSIVSHLRIIDESSRRMQQSLRDRLRLAGTAQLRLMVEVTRLALVQSDFVTLQTIVHNVAHEEGITAVAVVDRSGRVLAHSKNGDVGRLARGHLARAAKAERRSIHSAVLGGQRVMTFVEPVTMEQQRIGTVFVAYSLRPLEAELAQTAATRRRELRSGIWRTALVGLAALLIGVLLTVLQSLRLSRPIQELARQADEMAGGDLEARVPVRSGDEIGRLGERFNYMAEKMQGLIQEAITKATMEKELELAEASRLAAVGRLAAGVAHEVNNPLTYAKVNLQMLGRELENDEELYELAREALHGVGRIQNVVRQLSEFAQSRPSSLPGRVEEALRSAAKMAMVQLRDRAQLEMQVPALPQVTMEESKLAQVLLNLLVNAAQAIPSGNVEEHEVRVMARLVDRPAGEGPAAGHVEITVQDTGPGIPETVLPHIFESFFTTKQVGQGYGLGLSISRTMVQNVGGSLTAENVAEGGARFTLRLPLHEEDEGLDDETSPDLLGQTLQAPELPRERLTLLLVDDDPEVLRSLGRMLDPAFSVTRATSGRQALKILDERGDDFDLLLCDIMMPDGSGLEVADALRDIDPGLLGRLVLMTGGTPGIEREAMDRGVPVLGKPFELPEVLELVERLTQREREQDEQRERGERAAL